MKLPLRIRSKAGTETLLSVDGAFGAPGLNLSHWPGNTTPAELRHDLSTGSALLFAELPQAERARLAAGCTEICNNHVDTDGIFAMFAVAEPELALRHKDQLLKGAFAGDFFAPVDDEARTLDALMTACFDAEQSPWRGETAGFDEDARHTYDVQQLALRLPAILNGELAQYEALWKPVLEDWQADKRDLEGVSLDDLTHLDFCVWTAALNASSTRTHSPTEFFDPSRHALFPAKHSDRVLVVGPRSTGTTYRFLISTLSWFDQDSRACLPRPVLAQLADVLNELEGTTPNDVAAWHAHADLGASPELWFGTPGLPNFPLHASSHLALSKLDPQLVRAKTLAALRATWVFPE